MLPASATALAISAIVLLGSGAASAELSGRDLYQGIAAFAKGRNVTDRSLPEDFAACANCHGARGLGSSEGAGVVPPLQWAALSRPRDGLPAFGSGRAVTLAITQGRGRGGVPLSSAMPRYDLDIAEAEALTNYLRTIGANADVARGVTDKTIRLGTIVPLSGPLANAGMSIRDGIKTRFDRINKSGGVFGRTLQLVVLDSAASKVQIEKAMREANIYALVGSFWRQGDNLETVFSKTHTSAIASLTSTAEGEEAGKWNFPLLASPGNQSKLLAAALSQCSPEKPIWVVAAREELKSTVQFQIRQFASSDDLVAALATESRNGCLGLTLGQFQSIGDKNGSGWQKIIVLPFPAQVLQSKPDVWHGLGTAAAEIVLELLSNAGHALDEHALLDHLADLNGFAPLPNLPIKTGRRLVSAFAPELVTFNPRQDTADVLPKPY